MSLESDDKESLKEKDLIFILAIAGRIDAQSRLLAQELDKNRYVYYLYAAFDSLSSSYSMFKYFFDVYFAGSQDEMHDLMVSPAGIAGICCEAIFLVGFSLLACHFDKEKDGTYKKNIAEAWPYFRDVMKGLKNAYKGWRSAITTMGLLGMTDLNYLVLPIGLTLGVLGAANRYLIRSIRDARKNMMVQNRKLFLALAKLPSLTQEEVSVFLKNQGGIQYQSPISRFLGYFSAAVGGVIDGLYLYIGVLTIATFAPQLFIAMAVLCTLYATACVVTRVYEEYEFQIKLQITQTKCQLAILSKQIQTCHAKLLLLLNKDTDLSLEEQEQIAALKKKLSTLIDQFEEERQLLRKYSSTSYATALLSGLKYGLLGYGAMLSIVFLTSIFLILTGTAFPPAIIAGAVFLGLAFIVGFTAYALIEHSKHSKLMNKEPSGAYQKLIDMKLAFDASSDKLELLSKNELDEALEEGLSVPSAPTYRFQEWFEIFRSFFSGCGKGQKFVDFAGNPLQEMQDDGHYHDTPLMYALGAFCAIGFGITLALRALARGLGRSPLDANSDLASVITEPQKPSEQDQNDPEEIVETGYRTLGEADDTKVLGGSIQDQNPNAPKKQSTLLSSFGFFSDSTSTNNSSKFARSGSASNLDQLEPDAENIIAGLS